MSDNITIARSQEFTTMVEHLLQQQGSRLMGAVRRGSHTGKQAVPVDQLGVVEAQLKTARHADLPVVEMPHARRWVIPKTYQFRDFIDRPDQLRMLWDPRSGYAQSFAYAIGRAIDTEILAQLVATSVTGETGTGTESYDTGMDVAVSAPDGLTVAKLREARQNLMENNVDLDNDELYIAVGGRQAMELMADTTFTSTDFVGSPVLVDGKLKSFLGFNFIHTELVPTVGGDRECPYWVKSGAYLGEWEGVRTPIDWLPEKQAYQVAGCADFGATRLEAGRVGTIICDLA